MGLWFSVFANWQTVGAQLAAATFVIGSYVLAQELKVRRPRRRAAPATRRDPAGTARPASHLR